MSYRQSHIAPSLTARQVDEVPHASNCAPCYARSSLAEASPAPAPLKHKNISAEVIHSRNIDASLWQLKVHRQIGEFDASAWDAVVGDNAVTRSHAYLSAIERAAVSDCRYFYPVIYAPDGSMLAHACVYRVDTDFAQLMPTVFARLVKQLRRWWPRFLRARIIECGSPLFAGSSISVRNGVSREQVVRQLEQAMMTIAQGENSALLVLRDFVDSERRACDFLLDHGYKCVSNLPLARIPVRWGSYDEYLGSMRARYRKDIKRRLRRSLDSGRRVEILDSFADEAATWSRQAAAIYAQTSGFKRESINAEYYAAMDGCLGQQSQLLVVNHDGQRVAHGMVVYDGDNTVATFFGREAGPPSGEWFQLINEVIRLGIERGSTWISLGLGSYDAKTNSRRRDRTVVCLYALHPAATQRADKADPRFDEAKRISPTPPVPRSGQ